MADDFAKSLQQNPLFSAIGKIANPETYRIGKKPATGGKPGQPSNLKASYFANQPAYHAPGSNWGDGQKKASTKKATAKPAGKKVAMKSKDKKPKPGAKPNPFAKGKSDSKKPNMKPGFPAPKKKKGKK